MNNESATDRLLHLLYSLEHPSFINNGQHVQWPLSAMLDFNRFLKNPINRLNCIHVAGTNGKGSCCNILAALLKELGYKVGVYGSPHLLDVRERVKINGDFIDEKSISDYLDLVEDYSQISSLSGNSPFNSYSEVLVSLAFHYFSKKQVDFAIIETGIGGTLDPTNIIDKPLLCIISSIGHDHVELFGDNLEAIAIEKCGIIKPRVPVLVGPIDKELRTVFETQAYRRNAPIFFEEDLYDSLPDRFKYDPTFEFDLGGKYQHNNFRTISCAAYLLQEFEGAISSVSSQVINHAYSNAALLSNFHGRWEILCERPKVIIDISGNYLGHSYIFSQLKEEFRSKRFDRLVIILGLSSKKKIRIKELLPCDALYYYTEAYSFISAQELAESIGIPGTICSSVKSAITTYLQSYHPRDLVFIGGHIWVAAEALKHKYLFDNL